MDRATLTAMISLTKVKASVVIAFPPLSSALFGSQLRDDAA
jgi:hypothetical protein